MSNVNEEYDFLQYHIDQTEIAVAKSIRVKILITCWNQAYSQNNEDLTWSCILFKKTVATSVCCPIFCLRRKVSLEKGKSIYSYHRILYPVPKILNPNLNFKFRWRKIIPLAPRTFFLLTPTWIFLGIGDYLRFL